MTVPPNFFDLIYSRWTIRGPVADPETGSFIIEIDELPGFVVAAETKGEAIHEFNRALRTHLQAYVDAGREIPKPQGGGGWTPVRELKAFKPAFEVVPPPGSLVAQI